VYKDRSPIEIISLGERNSYYKKLLMADRTSFAMNETSTRETIIKCKSILVTTEEVELAMKKLVIGKAAEPGNTPSELLKNVLQKLYTMIKQLSTICINEQIIHEWKIVHTTLIFKQGDRKNCDYYRVISVTSTFSRLNNTVVW
jgi:hypothetical protein